MKKIYKSQIPSLIQSHLPHYRQAIIQKQPLFGMTNYILKVSAPDLPPIVFRLFGEGFHRLQQNQIVRELSKKGIAPQIYYQCSEYRIEEFIEGVHPECRHIFEYENGLMKRIIQKIYELHSVELPESIPRINLVETFFNRNKIESIPKQKNEDADQFNHLKNKFLHKFQQIHQLYLSRSLSINQSLKFSHNDLNNLNILVTPNQAIKLLDYDYSGYNHPAFDIANFLSQFCLVFIEEKPAFKVYKRLSEEDIKMACSFYPGEVEYLQEYIWLMLVLCNWKWGIWSLEIGRPDLNSLFEPLKHGYARYELMEYYKERYLQRINRTKETQNK